MAFFITIFTIIILIPLYFFLRWPIRKLMMKMLAKKMKPSYKPKDKIDINSIIKNGGYKSGLGIENIPTDNNARNVISGKYKNKDILIYEVMTTTGTAGYEGTSKVFNIFVDNIRLFSESYNELLWPPTSRIKKNIDNYIERGVVPEIKKRMNSALLLVILTFAILIILLIILLNSKM